MADYTTLEDWTNVRDGYVVSVTIRRTDDPQYPSGWDYSLHLGEVGGETILRYDNAHPESKGHERHTRDGNETNRDFPGMKRLYQTFIDEVTEKTPPTVKWDWEA